MHYYRAIDELRDILRNKRGDQVGIVTTGGSVTFGTVTVVNNDVLTLSSTVTAPLTGLPLIVAPVAFIPLAQIVTLLDDIDVGQFKSQVNG